MRRLKPLFPVTGSSIQRYIIMYRRTGKSIGVHMGTQEFFSDNDTETMADALKAIGLAEVFRAWFGAIGRPQAPITIVDRESHYTITLPSPLGVEDIERVSSPFIAGRGKLLMSAKQIEKAQQSGHSSTLPAYAYDEERARSTEYFSRLKKLLPADRKRFNQHPDAEEFEGIRGLIPNADLDLYTYINHFRTATNYNDLLLQWAGNGDLNVFRRNLGLILTIFSQRPNALATAEARW